MQQVSKITIPELAIFGLSSMNAIKAFTITCSYECTQLKSKYPNNNVDSLQGYKVSRLEKMLLNICTYIMVVEECHDYIVATSILRILLDEVASYHFIYHAENKEEVLLRHYLFVIDGILAKWKLYREHPLHYSSKISYNEYMNLAEKTNAMKDNLSISKTLCVSKIKALQCYSLHTEIIEKLIKHGNWKYINLKGIRQYTWSELHKKISKKRGVIYEDFGNYLSQYVHGLSNSVISLNAEDLNLFESLSNIVILFLDFIREVMATEFDVDNKFLLNDFTKSPEYQAYMSFVNH